MQKKPSSDFVLMLGAKIFIMRQSHEIAFAGQRSCLHLYRHVTRLDRLGGPDVLAVAALVDHVLHEAAAKAGIRTNALEGLSNGWCHL